MYMIVMMMIIGSHLFILIFFFLSPSLLSHFYTCTLTQVMLSVASTKHNHIPYRQSKLTHYLSDTLQTASQIVLLAIIRGEAEFIEETVREILS